MLYRVGLSANRYSGIESTLITGGKGTVETPVCFDT